ncbi:hypothetical protein [Sphingopyxis panaciterrae]
MIDTSIACTNGNPAAVRPPNFIVCLSETASVDARATHGRWTEVADSPFHLKKLSADNPLIAGKVLKISTARAVPDDPSPTSVSKD